jgi:hypothetical protein
MVNVIAKSNSRTKGLKVPVVKLACAFSALAMLNGCVSLDLFGGDKVDSSITTSSVSHQPALNVQTDDATVRNAVTSADLSKLADAPLPWANAATGSAGVVTGINEERGLGFVCRNFQTTRHSFDGVASYAGQACLSEAGEWLLTRFDQK